MSKILTQLARWLSPTLTQKADAYDREMPELRRKAAHFDRMATDALAADAREEAAWREAHPWVGVRKPPKRPISPLSRIALNAGRAALAEERRP